MEIATRNVIFPGSVGLAQAHPLTKPLAMGDGLPPDLVQLRSALPILEYVKVVPFSRCSNGPRALFRDDQVVMQPTMTTLPTLSSIIFLLLIPISLASSALSKLSPLFLITSDLNRDFGATSVSLCIEDRASTQPLCSQDFHTASSRFVRATR